MAEEQIGEEDKKKLITAVEEWICAVKIMRVGLGIEALGVWGGWYGVWTDNGFVVGASMAALLIGFGLAVYGLRRWRKSKARMMNAMFKEANAHCR